jgi:hypothetical protein
MCVLINLLVSLILLQFYKDVIKVNMPHADPMGPSCGPNLPHVQHGININLDIHLIVCLFP